MQLGILVNDLGFHQEAFMLLMQTAKLCSDIKNTCIIFQKKPVPPCLIPMCTVVNISEVYSFKGVLLVTTLENLRIAKSIGKMTSDIIYYPMDLEWLRNEKDFINNYKLLNSVTVVTQNKFHTEAVNKYAGIIPKYCIENMDFNKLIGIYESSR